MALAIIMVWYVSIGALSAAGSMYLSHRFVPAKHGARVMAEGVVHRRVAQTFLFRFQEKILTAQKPAHAHAQRHADARGV